MSAVGRHPALHLTLHRRRVRPGGSADARPLRPPRPTPRAACAWPDGIKQPEPSALPLKPVTHDFLALVERETGYPMRLIEDPSLETLARIRDGAGVIRRTREVSVTRYSAGHRLSTLEGEAHLVRRDSAVTTARASLDHRQSVAQYRLTAMRGCDQSTAVPWQKACDSVDRPD